MIRINCCNIRYRKSLKILLLMIFSFGKSEAQQPVLDHLDWQGHRGCRGLLPENSIAAFLKALEYPVTTLELDLAVSKDGQLVISHDPWFSEHICSKPDGAPIKKSEASSLRIYGMTYEEITAYDCGSRGNVLFPQQKALPAHKPALREMVKAVQYWCIERNRPVPHFNIEIKSKPEWDGVFSPPPREFVTLLLKAVDELGIRNLTCVQSFDVRPLQELRSMDRSITIALLVENLDGVDQNLSRLGFTPQVYSPYYRLLRKKHIRKLHQAGVAVIPWTVNDVRAMKRLRRQGVDGIITDYPNLIGDL